MTDCKAVLFRGWQISYDKYSDGLEDKNAEDYCFEANEYDVLKGHFFGKVIQSVSEDDISTPIDLAAEITSIDKEIIFAYTEFFNNATPVMPKTYLICKVNY